MRHRAFNRTAFIFTIGAASVFAPALCQAPAPAYIITTFAGNNTGGFAGDAGAATAAEINNPYGLALDKSGNLYIADQLNYRVREVSNGNISTVAGNGTEGFLGDKAAATSAELDRPSGVAVDSSGNLYIADTNNCVIRKVAGSTITTYAGSNTNYTVACGASGDQGLAVNAQLAGPTGVALDAAGNLYIADTLNNRIRKVAASTGIITTLSTGNSVILSGPRGVAVDAAGNVYIADTGNSRVRKVTPSGSITVTTTVAGTGVAGFGGDGGPASSAQLSSPAGVAVDAAGNIYIADTNNNRIRRVSAATGTITTVGGSGRSGYAGDGGLASTAQLSFPRGMVVDASGKVYVSDVQNNVIRLLAPVAPSIGGVITADQYGSFTSIAPGTFIEIYGSGLAADTLYWGDFFNGVNAPTLLDGTTVTIGGQLAYIAFASPGQVNVLVPSNVGTGQQQITVANAAGTSAPYAVTVNPTAAGMYAPAGLNVGGMQYVGALTPDLQNFILPPGAVSSVNSQRAKPGDIIVIFGIGFGPVIPNIPAGQLVQQSNQLATLPFQIFFGSTPAMLQYWGLAPTLTGLYQFNVVVPNVPPSDAVPLTFTLGGVNGAQTLYTAVGN